VATVPPPVPPAGGAAGVAVPYAWPCGGDADGRLGFFPKRRYVPDRGAAVAHVAFAPDVAEIGPKDFGPADAGPSGRARGDRGPVTCERRGACGESATARRKVW